MQFRCDKEKRVVLVLGKGLICRQKLQIHLGMRDSSRWDHAASIPRFFITMRQAEALTSAKARTLSNSLILVLIQSHYEYIYNAGNVSEKYCAQYDIGYPLLLTLGFQVVLPWLPHQLHRSHFFLKTFFHHWILQDYTTFVSRTNTIAFHNVPSRNKDVYFYKEMGCHNNAHTSREMSRLENNKNTL